ncbi:carboxylate-amine ligase [Pseudomonas alkylphenolica]|uniref:carboxylate-amine ligase n=1 Tax=Pseudomonas alkylphenolica TaxID=237609 RepID=UPI0018D6FD77|nr:carboxylate-amine ligase [Pseudomonas alkylphenolica]MBH3428919.1 carboxylate-amine ligase [Pseudomonas alkylphenolica]
MKPGFGIEEEFLLVDLDSLQVVAEPSAAALNVCRETFGRHFSQEMFKSQIELVSPVFFTIPQARDFLRSHRQRLASRLAPHGLGICAAGSHPFGGWRAQQPAPGEHYHQLFEDHRHVARRSLVCGLHIHVGIDPDHDRIPLINQLLPWLPLLLVLSTSSPFWEGQPSGYRSYRRVLCNEWPRMGLPEPLLDWNDYQRYLDLLHRTGALRPESDCWWLIRPSRRYPTVELRIADGCPHLEDSLCIADVFRQMVDHCLERPASSARPTCETLWITQENLWRAMRDGRDGCFIDPVAQAPISAQAWLLQLQARFAIAAQAMEYALRILTRGTSADLQLAVYERALTQGFTQEHALSHVVNELLHTSAALDEKMA